MATELASDYINGRVSSVLFQSIEVEDGADEPVAGADPL
jgi:hypothetical protein